MLSGVLARAAELPERFISKDWNDYPLVQISRIDRQPHTFGGSVKGHPRSENRRFGDLTAGLSAHQNATEGGASLQPLIDFAVHHVSANPPRPLLASQVTYGVTRGPSLIDHSHPNRNLLLLDDSRA